jgi:enamine deaminase RidA (YjgF/YER057c/UK114 family)
VLCSFTVDPAFNPSFFLLNFQTESTKHMIQYIEPGARMTQALVHQKTVYLAGQVAEHETGADVYLQTKDALAGVERLLAAAGSNKANILSATIWLTDMDTFADMNRAWDEWVVQGATPARATVHSQRLAAPEYLVEISVVAAQI